MYEKSPNIICFVYINILFGSANHLNKYRHLESLIQISKCITFNWHDIIGIVVLIIFIIYKHISFKIIIYYNT